uniref:G protein-coupled receptor n=1 Tax=Toxocara canis TaxID=6265 RepID=A0A183U275_TOXCA
LGRWATFYCVTVTNCYSLYYDCNDSGQSTSLFGDLMYTNHNVYYVASMFGSALCAGYVIAITLSIAISREIKRLKTLCSKKTIELQNRLLRALILQVRCSVIGLIEIKRTTQIEPKNNAQPLEIILHWS